MTEIVTAAGVTEGFGSSPQPVNTRASSPMRVHFAAAVDLCFMREYLPARGGIWR
jgi:hypothetical protein